MQALEECDSILFASKVQRSLRRVVVCVVPAATQHLTCAGGTEGRSDFVIRRLGHVIARERRTGLYRAPLAPA
jgi:hypothetical protein